MSSAYASSVSDVIGLLGHEKGQEISDRQLLDRFITDGDESAFVNLVQRYARGVWGVCRRMLRQEQDAEDAFQAVFMILARKAASIRKGEAVGSWLYSVAYRTAMKARMLASKRTAREKKATVTHRDETPASEAAWRELQRQLDEELQLLAEKYKAPFVLCCLEGMSRADAARELGWKEGTVSSRLAQAKKLLQSRLARRGVVLSAVLTAVALSQNAATAAAPPALVSATMLTTQGEAISCSAAALANNVLSTMGLAKFKAAIGLVIAVTALLGTTVFAGFAVFPQGEPEAKKINAVETFVPPPMPIRKPIDEQVLALAFTPDGKKLVTAGARHTDPGQLKVWDVTSGAELARVRGIVGARSVAVSPNGMSIVTGHFGGAVVRRDAATGEEQVSVQAHSAGVNGLAFSRDGDRLASAGLDRTVKILDPKTLREFQVLRGHTNMVFGVAFFKHGKSVVSGGNDKTAIIWDLGAGKAKHILRGHRGPIETVAISPDDKYVATASWDKTVKIWNAQTGADLGTFAGSKGDLLAVAFSPNGEMLATGSREGAVCLWDVKSRTMLRVLGNHNGAVWAVEFSPAGDLVASGGSDKTARLWKTSGRNEFTIFQTSEIRPIQALAYAPDGNDVAVAGSGDKSVRLLDPRTGDMLLALNGHSATVNCVAYAPDGLTLATGSADMTVKIWERKNGKVKFTLQGHAGAVHAVAITADGKKIASAGDDMVVKIWNAETGEESAAINAHQVPVRALAFAADGRTLAGGGSDGTILLSYLDKAADAIKLQGHDSFVRALAFSGERLASAGDDGKIKIWKAAPGTSWKPAVGKEPLTLKGHPGGVMALAFAPGGNSVVSGGRNGMVMVWDTASGRPRGFLSGHKGDVTALAIHPHGDHLISGGADAALLRWRSGTSKEPVVDLQPIPDPPAQGGPAPPPDATPAPKSEPAIPSPDAPVINTPGGRGWLAAAVLIGFAAMLLICGSVGLIFYLRQNRQTTTKSASSVKKPSEDAPSPILVQCAKCDRKLKVKAALAGKAVKCMCGAAVAVPDAKTAGLENAAESLVRKKGVKGWLILIAAGMFLALLAAAVLFVASYWSRSSSFVNVAVGQEFVPGIEESGFFGQLHDQEGKPYRWTNGAGKLFIPIDAKNPPKALRLHLWPWRPADSEPAKLRIVVNEKEMFHAVLSRDPWKLEFNLAGMELGDRVAVQINSGTFPPPRELKEERGQFTMLGVQVRGVELLGPTTQVGSRF